MRRAKPGNQRLKGSTARSSPPPGRSAIGGRACRAQAGRPDDGTRWDTGTRPRRPAARNALLVLHHRLGVQGERFGAPLGAGANLHNMVAGFAWQLWEPWRTIIA